MTGHVQGKATARCGRAPHLLHNIPCPLHSFSHFPPLPSRSLTGSLSFIFATTFSSVLLFPSIFSSPLLAPSAPPGAGALCSLCGADKAWSGYRKSQWGRNKMLPLGFKSERCHPETAGWLPGWVGEQLTCITLTGRSSWSLC